MTAKKKVICVDTGEVIIQNGEYWFDSPLTIAKFQVTPRLGTDEHGRDYVYGYEVFTPGLPACIIGNNVLVENSVPAGVAINTLLLKHALTSNGYPNDWLDKHDAEVEFVTLVYLFNFADTKDARKCLKMLRTLGTALNNKTRSPGTNPVFAVGSEGDECVYFKGRNFRIRAYVKWGETRKGFCNIESQQLRDEIYGYGAQLLRVEIELSRTLLNRLGLSKAQAWSRVEGRNPYDLGLDLIRKYFRFDDHLNTRKPRQDVLNKLPDDWVELLDDHFRGIDLRSHPLITGDRTERQQARYFSRLKCSLIKDAGVDISIFWANQSLALGQKLDGKTLKEIIQHSRRFKIPLAMRPHSFCRETVRLKIQLLKQLIAELDQVS